MQDKELRLKRVGQGMVCEEKGWGWGENGEGWERKRILTRFIISLFSSDWNNEGSMNRRGMETGQSRL
jgi:hypothetical protein